MAYKQAVGIVLPEENIGLTIYADIIDTGGNVIVAGVVTVFIEVGLGQYTFYYEDYPNDFYGTVAFYNQADDVFLASTEINPTIPTVPFIGQSLSATRQRDIIILQGDTTNILWLHSHQDDPSEIVFTIKYDMEDPVEDAMLVVSLTNGCETVLGAPTGDASLATIWRDANYVYVIMKAELTLMFSSVTGIQKYDVKYTVPSGIYTIGYGNSSVVLSGAS